VKQPRLVGKRHCWLELRDGRTHVVKIIGEYLKERIVLVEVPEDEKGATAPRRREAGPKKDARTRGEVIHFSAMESKQTY